MKVNLEFDTESKEYTVSVDGTPLENVVSFSLYCVEPMEEEVDEGMSDGGEDAEEKPCGSINIGIQHPADGGLRKYTHISAKDNNIVLSNDTTNSNIESTQDYFRKVLRVKK